jgi:hypothetical protein
VASTSVQTYDWRRSARRVALHVVVTGLHVGFVIFLLGDFAALKQRPLRSSTSARDALRIRFVQPVSTTKIAAPPVPPVPPRLRKKRSHVTSPRPLATTSPPTATPTAREPASIKASSNASDDRPGYIAGGSLLHGSSTSFGSRRIRLPGSNVSIVNNLPMMDPRAQGIAGVVRAMQVILGAPNPHCVDVDVWRGLSVREQLDRHMSPDQVEETAQKFGCGPPD